MPQTPLSDKNTFLAKYYRASRCVDGIWWNTLRRRIKQIYPGPKYTTRQIPYIILQKSLHTNFCIEVSLWILYNNNTSPLQGFFTKITTSKQSPYVSSCSRNPLASWYLIADILKTDLFSISSSLNMKSTLNLAYFPFKSYNRVYCFVTTFSVTGCSNYFYTNDY